MSPNDIEMNSVVGLTATSVNGWKHPRLVFFNCSAHIVCGLAANCASLQNLILGGTVHPTFRIVTLSAGILVSND